MIGQNLSKPETVISKRITRIFKFSYNYNPTVFSNGQQRGMAIKYNIYIYIYITVHLGL